MLIDDTAKILGDERATLLQWLGPEALCYNMMQPDCRSQKETIRWLNLKVSRAQKANQAHYERNYMQSYETGTIPHDASLYELPWPNLARRIGFTEQDIIASWPAGEFYEDDQEWPANIPSALEDNQGHHFVLFPLKTLSYEYVFRDIVTVTHEKKKYERTSRLSLNGNWKTVLRLDDAQAWQVLNALMAVPERIDDVLCEQARVETTAANDVVLILTPANRTAMKTAVDKELGKLANTLDAEQIKLLGFALMASFNIDSLTSTRRVNVLAGIYPGLYEARGRAPVKLHIHVEKNDAEIKLMQGNNTLYQSSSVYRDVWPRFIQKFMSSEERQPSEAEVTVRDGEMQKEKPPAGGAQ